MSEVIDNRANRIRVLKDIIKHLHAGNPPEAVQTPDARIVKQTDASEIMAMEQELMAEGMPVEEVRSMCDLHAQVTRDVLVQIPTRKEIAPGHPVDTFRTRKRSSTQRDRPDEDGTCRIAEPCLKPAIPLRLCFAFASRFNELMDIDKHYQRKEHALVFLPGAPWHCRPLEGDVGQGRRCPRLA